MKTGADTKTRTQREDQGRAMGKPEVVAAASKEVYEYVQCIGKKGKTAHATSNESFLLTHECERALTSY
jgi:RNA 3'-terminal phosphate cyclase